MNAPVPCWFCGALVSEDREGRLYATNPGIEKPWVCPGNGTGHRVRLLVNWEDTPELRAAWLAYDKVARALPQCEHVLAWQKEVVAARKTHHKAIKERDKLWKQQVQDDLAKAEAKAREAEEVHDERPPDG